MKLNEIRAGTVGGTLCSIWASITLGDILQTVVTAVIGTVASYVVSQLLQSSKK